MNRACSTKGKTPEFTKIGEIHELFVLALSLVWFAGATPELSLTAKYFQGINLHITGLAAISGQFGVEILRSVAEHH